MIRIRKYGTLAALGGLTVATALLTSPSTARAEDPAGVDNQLLQSRLDQLAQMPAGAPGGPAPVLSGSFPRSFVLPGTDTSLRVGGQGLGDVTWYWHGSAVGGALNGQGGFNETYMDGGGGTGNLPSVPLNGSIAHSRSGEFDLSGRSSRMFFDAQTPSPYGTVKAYVEFDFSASNTNTILNNNAGVVNGNIPRLRKGYAAIGPLLIGQDSGTFTDPDADADILDQGGQTGSSGRGRLPVARYTIPLPAYGASLALAMENPDSDFAGPFGGYQTDTNGVPTAASCAALAQTALNSISPTTITALPTTLTTTNAATNITNACLGQAAFFDAAQNTMPDYVARLRFDQPWGHLQLGAVVRDVTLNDGKFLNKSWVGYGAALSGNLTPFVGNPNPWGKDNFTWQIVAGNGIGNYIANGGGAVATNYGAPLGPGAVAASSSASIYTTNRALYDSLVGGKTITGFGLRGGYTHYWTPELRSNMAFSMNHADMNGALLTGVGQAANNKELLITHTNIIWSPVTFVDLGFEFQWGHREVQTGVKGDEFISQGQLKVRF